LSSGTLQLSTRCSSVHFSLKRSFAVKSSVVPEREAVGAVGGVARSVVAAGWSCANANDEAARAIEVMSARPALGARHTGARPVEGQKRSVEWVTAGVTPFLALLFDAQAIG
jgi:hypothetical protein